jgi:mono/diheme cytochrome c family protein
MARGIDSTLAVAILFFSGCTKHDTPVASLDEAVPQITAMSPSTGENFVAVDQQFVVEFSEAMDVQTVEDNFGLTIAQKPVVGHYLWNDAATKVAFQPTSPLPANAEIQVNFGPGIYSRRGQRLVGAAGQPVSAYGYGCFSYGYPTTFSSNGEQIYFTGTSISGDPITFNMHYDYNPYGIPAPAAAPYGGMMGRGMMGNSWNSAWGNSSGMQGGMTCANCHGPDGQGNRYLAMGQVVTPDIRYSTLAGHEEEDHAEGEDTDADHGEEEAEHGHIPYDEASIKQAITQGIEPDGEPLNSFMPRWSMSDQDLDDLVEFLKML